MGFIDVLPSIISTALISSLLIVFVGTGVWNYNHRNVDSVNDSEDSDNSIEGND